VCKISQIISFYLFTVYFSVCNRSSIHYIGQLSLLSLPGSGKSITGLSSWG